MFFAVLDAVGLEINLERCNVARKFFAALGLKILVVHGDGCEYVAEEDLLTGILMNNYIYACTDTSTKIAVIAKDHSTDATVSKAAALGMALVSNIRTWLLGMPALAGVLSSALRAIRPASYLNHA